MEGKLVGIGGNRNLVAIDIWGAQHNWQIEQRLGAIADAREQGALSPEEADARELEALRALRNSVFERGMSIPLNMLHTVWQEEGGQHVNVTRPPLPYAPSRAKLAE